jgi:hypothetical protein
MAGTRGVKNPAEKKEHSQDRRRRLERDRRAKETAQRILVPVLLAGLAVLVVLFFWKYGFGGVRSAATK